MLAIFSASPGSLGTENCWKIVFITFVWRRRMEIRSCKILRHVTKPLDPILWGWMLCYSNWKQKRIVIIAEWMFLWQRNPFQSPGIIKVISNFTSVIFPNCNSTLECSRIYAQIYAWKWKQIIKIFNDFQTMKARNPNAKGNYGRRTVCRNWFWFSRNLFCSFISIPSFRMLPSLMLL